MRKVTAVLLLFLFLSAAVPTYAQEGIRVISESASYTFAREMVFEIAIEGELREANLYYRIEGEIAQHYHRAEIDGGMAKEIIFLYPGEIPPAAEITYFWRLEDVRGYLWRTDEKSFLYLDQRFLWQSQKRGEIAVFWYGQKEQLADAVFAQLGRSFNRVEERLGLEQKEPIKVVIYRDWHEMVPALASWDGETIVAGAAFSHRTLVFFLWPGWEETLTHELTHLLTHQLMGEPYDYLPFWLSEGLATYTESATRGPITEPLRLSYLSSKPTKVELIGPAYAQSQSLVAFLIEKHGGKEKISQLLTTLAAGTTVDDALLTTYGFDRQGLEREWRKWIGHPLPTVPVPTKPPTEEIEIKPDAVLVAFAELAEIVIVAFLFLTVLFLAMRRSK